MDLATRRRRQALFLFFFLPGIAMSSWVTRTPDIRDRLEASTGQMGWVLFGLSLGSMMGILCSGRLVSRFGTRPVIGMGTALVVVSMGAVAAAGRRGRAGRPSRPPDRRPRPPAGRVGVIPRPRTAATSASMPGTICSAARTTSRRLMGALVMVGAVGNMGVDASHLPLLWLTRCAPPAADHRRCPLDPVLRRPG